MLIGLWVSAVVAAGPVAHPPGCTPLQTAAMGGDVEQVRRLGGRSLLGLGPSQVALEATGTAPGVCFGRTALMLAAEYGQLEAARVLLGSRAQVDATAELKQFGDHPFDARCLAIATGHAALVQLLDRAGAGDRACTSDARLFGALHAGSFEQLRQQLRGNPDSAVLLAALAALAGQQRPGMVAELVDHALNMGVEMGPAWAAAIEANDLFMVQSLARHARLSGSVELARAVTLGRTEMVKPLVAAGARTDLKPMHDALFEVLRTQQGTVLQALLDAGWRGDDDAPTLVWAMRFYPEYVFRFLAYHVGVDVDDADGVTPLMLAVEEHHPEWIAPLVERGASAVTADVTCRTAISRAFDAGETSPALHGGPVEPGRAARRLHVGCGQARFRLRFEPGVEVYFDGAYLALAPGTVYQTNPGLHTLRIARAAQRAVKRVNVELVEGLNELEAAPAEDDGR